MNKKGFTLTEILIVIVIGAILVALIVPRALRAIAHANFVADKSNVESLEEALLVCYADTRDWDQCADIASDLVPAYIKNTPIHPCNGSYALMDATAPEIGTVVVNTDPCDDPLVVTPPSGS